MSNILPNICMILNLLLYSNNLAYAIVGKNGYRLFIGRLYLVHYLIISLLLLD